MKLIAVPNISEGRRHDVVRRLLDALEIEGARVLDVHTDAVHNRTVTTLTGAPDELVAGARSLAVVAKENLDLTEHEGAHPRVGVVDVLPFVDAAGESVLRAAEAAVAAGEAVAVEAGIPVYFYGEMGRKLSLPEIRRGGLDELIRRCDAGFLPDLGPPRIDRRVGVVCVGARRPLIAFNVWLRCGGDAARAVADAVRTAQGGLQGIRALGFVMDEERAQVSMNLTKPDTTGIDAAFDVVAGIAGQKGIAVIATEIVGLVPERYLPSPDAEAARLLMKPGRSLEAALREA